MMNRNKGEEKKGKGTRGGQVPFSPRASLAHSLTFHLVALRLSLFLCFTHIATANRPCSFLSTNTHSHTGPTFASLNSLICTYAHVCVCVWVYYLCFLCRQKNFYHKKITALVLSRLEKKQKKCISKIKKKWKKRSATLPRHQQRLHFCMRATFSHLLYVCLECSCVCVCVCCNFLLTPASACHVLLLVLSFVCVCVCVSVAPFTVFIILFGVGHKNTPLCCCC